MLLIRQLWHLGDRAVPMLIIRESYFATHDHHQSLISQPFAPVTHREEFQDPFRCSTSWKAELSQLLHSHLHDTRAFEQDVRAPARIRVFLGVEAVASSPYAHRPVR